MMPEWLDSHLVKTLAMYIPSAALGTLWRAIVSPSETIMEMVKGGFVAITVGMLVGGSAVQYMKMDGFMSYAIIAIASYLAPHILRYFDHKGNKLRQGKIDISLKGDDKP